MVPVLGRHVVEGEQRVAIIGVADGVRQAGGGVEGDAELFLLSDGALEIGKADLAEGQYRVARP